MEKFFTENLESGLWADMTEAQMDAIPDLQTRNEYKKKAKEAYVIINKFSTLVSKDFRFSVPKDKLTCRIMLGDYMDYFYSKGMSREDIISTLAGSTITLEEGKKK